MSPSPDDDPSSLHVANRRSHLVRCCWMVKVSFMSESSSNAVAALSSCWHIIYHNIWKKRNKEKANKEKAQNQWWSRSRLCKRRSAHWGWALFPDPHHEHLEAPSSATFICLHWWNPGLMNRDDIQIFLLDIEMNLNISHRITAYLSTCQRISAYISAYPNDTYLVYHIRVYVYRVYVSRISAYHCVSSCTYLSVNQRISAHNSPNISEPQPISAYFSAFQRIWGFFCELQRISAHRISHYCIVTHRISSHHLILAELTVYQRTLAHLSVSLKYTRAYLNVSQRISACWDTLRYAERISVHFSVSYLSVSHQKSVHILRILAWYVTWYVIRHVIRHSVSFAYSTRLNVTKRISACLSVSLRISLYQSISQGTSAYLSVSDRITVHLCPYLGVFQRQFQFCVFCVGRRIIAQVWM